MDDRQLLRYSRHILLPEFGIEGQRRLAAATALVVGVGGLGCPAALYLAACGVGRLVLADGDRVDLTNLQRQILYRAEAIGRPKVEAAAEALAAVNPEVELVPVADRLAGEALDREVARADVVLDCSDNFATRHAVNRACVAHGKPLVAGAAIRFDAQLAVFDLRAPDSPCYCCLFPESVAAEEVECAQLGVLAPMTGALGALQALETVKLLVGLSEQPAGRARLSVYDARRGEWRTVRLVRDPQCTACAARPR